MSDTPSLDPDAPIDAEFEPAEPKTMPRPSLSGGSVVYFALGLAAVSFVIALLGSGWIPGLSSGGGSVSKLSTQVETLQTELASAEELHSAMQSQIDTMRTVNQQNRTSNRQLGEQYQALTERLERAETSVDAVAAAIKAVETVQSNMVTATDETGAPVIAEASPMLISRIETLETALSNLGGEEGDQTELEAEVEGLIVDLAALRADLSLVKQAQDNAAVAIRAAEGTAADAALALSAIEAAARRGRPFLIAHQQLVEALPGNRAAEALAPLSVSGAPTMADLRVRFAPLKRSALDEEARAAGAGSGLLRSVFGDGIKVRREGTEGAVDVLDEAEAALAEGNLSRAIVLIESLGTPVQTVFTDWVSSAKQRESLESALEALRLTMIAEDR